MEENRKPFILETLKGNQLHVHLEFEEGFRKCDYQYAFYLKKDEERAATVWYQDAAETVFEIGASGTYHTVSFVRSIRDGSTTPYLSGNYFSYVETGTREGYTDGRDFRDCSVSIWGSCVSRDLLECQINGQMPLQLCKYIARQSIVSAVSEPVAIEREIGLASAFQKRMVECDLLKTGFSQLQAEKSEYLILDLIDERFDLVKIGNSFATLSNEATTSGIFGDSPEVVKKRKAKGTYWIGDKELDEYIGQFTDRLLQVYKPEQIIIHVARMRDYYLDENGAVKRFPANYLHANRRTNDVLDYMYQKLRERMPGAAWIDTGDQYCADSRHKWGLSPMHYRTEYYEHVLSEILRITSGKE